MASTVLFSTYSILHTTIFTCVNLQYASRDIEENLVRSSYLKKLNKLSRRWFVLYGASSINAVRDHRIWSQVAICDHM